MLNVRPSRQRGFSMIELAVTLTVLALVLAAAFPSVSDWVRNTKVRNAAETAQAGLQKARNEALRRNQNVTFWLVGGPSVRVVDDNCALSSSSGSWVVSIRDPSGNCETAPASITLIEKHPAGDGGDTVTVSALAPDGTTAATCVRFNGFGRVVDESVPPDDGCRPPDQISTIDFTHAGTGARRLRVAISGGGGVRMCDRDVVAPDPRACTP